MFKFSYFLIAVTLIMSFLGYGYLEATRDPIARGADVIVPDWPKDTPPLKIILLSDTQMAGPDMTPERLSAIVEQVNTHNADIIALAGDYISQKTFSTKHYTAGQSIAPLKNLKANMGIVAVLGNHDYWAGEEGFIAAFNDANIPVLRNEAISIGPINMVGIDDEFTRHHDIEAAEESLKRLSPAPNVVLTHGPDVTPKIKFDTAVILAGHTHCGQIKLPFIGAIKQVSRYGERFECGYLKDRYNYIVISAGLGTSIFPIRINAPPDFWVITLKGQSE